VISTHTMKIIAFLGLLSDFVEWKGMPTWCCALAQEIFTFLLTPKRHMTCLHVLEASSFPSSSMPAEHKGPLDTWRVNTSSLRLPPFFFKQNSTGSYCPVDLGGGAYWRSLSLARSAGQSAWEGAVKGSRSNFKKMWKSELVGHRSDAEGCP